MRGWYELPITLLGVVLALLGYGFFALVTFSGAPWVPWIGFAVGSYGAWLAVGRRLLSRRRGSTSR